MQLDFLLKNKIIVGLHIEQSHYNLIEITVILNFIIHFILNQIGIGNG